MGAAGVVEIIQHHRQFFDDGLVGGNFAVEHAERIDDSATLAIVAHVVDDAGQRFAQRLVVNRAAFIIADGIQFQLPVPDADTIQKRAQHFDDFGIHAGRFAAGGGRADDLGADLVELAIAAFLRALAAELRADVKKLLQARPLPQFVLDVGAHHAGGILRAQRQPLRFFRLGAAAIFPGKHFFADDIGLFPHGALEELQILDDRGANLAEVVHAEDVAHRSLGKIPKRRLRRQQVAGSADGFDRSRQSSVLSRLLDTSERSEESLLSRPS